MGTFLSLKAGDVDLSYPDVARLTVERKRGRKFSSRGRGVGRFFCSFLATEAKTALMQYLTVEDAVAECYG